MPIRLTHLLATIALAAALSSSAAAAVAAEPDCRALDDQPCAVRKELAGLLAAAALAAALSYSGAAQAWAADAAPSGQLPEQVAAANMPPEVRSPAAASIQFSGGQVAAGIGYSWGSGTLAFDGRRYPFHIEGLSIANVGASTVSAAGQVYHLRSIRDFPGTYAAVSAGATVGGGESVTYLRNEHGVVIELIATSAGLDFQLSGNGVKISLD